MSKLDEVQELLDIMIYGSEHITAAMAYEKATTVLRELNKPVQYVVEIKQPDLAFEIEEYSAYMNGHCTVSADTISEIKDRVLLHINKIRGFLSLPPITIEQITFVEI